ncbi:T9SS type A sorting domain-containing protein [Hymenobacter sp. B1770]|uniref:T9SS type A sorting domain-containing protein n=1 Tax=Hymenobacter sp. B1770 TaxID=1718788 RepID=UPI003CF4A7A0
MKKLINNVRNNFYSLSKALTLPKQQLLMGLVLLVLTALANPATATEFTRDYVILNGTRYYTNSNGGGSEPSFLGIRDLGSFDRATGSLLLGAEANTNETGNDDVQSVQLFYRVYLQGTPRPSPETFTSLALNLAGTGSGPNARDKQWVNTTSNPNLLANTSGPGTYVLEVFFQGLYSFRRAGGGTALIFDNNAGGNYTVTFTVTGRVPVQWTGAQSDDWFDPLNWNPNIVPTRTTDATIAFFQNGRYPTIRGGVAQVRTLSILGDNGALGARNFLAGGALEVYGDFKDPHGGFGQSGGLFILAGETQTFDGGVFLDFVVQGGGTKILTNRMDILSSLTFSGLGGIVSTRTDNSIVYNIDLAPNAQVIGESETSHVLGILRAQRFVNTGVLNNFGNIGVSLITNGAIAPGITLATRITGYVFNGVPPSKSVKRGFTFVSEHPEDQNFTLSFRYLDAEVNGITEDDLLLFRSLTGSVPFTNLQRSTLDVVNNVLTRVNIPGTLAAIFTLGDQLAPLPVGLTSFTAVASGTDAVLNWTTAQEINNKGFEVQASDDGVAFRKLGFVAARTPNSSTARNYQYRDAAGVNAGTRYYRLRQLDLDDKESFFGPRAVTFGAAATAAVQGYPNPFTSEINLTLQAPVAGQATVSVLDNTGRQVRTWQPTLGPDATTSMSLPDLQSLSRGLYVVQVRYSNGQVQRLKLVKE